MEGVQPGAQDKGNGERPQEDRGGYTASAGYFLICTHMYMSLCQKVLGKDHPFFGRKCFFRFKFSLNKPNFIRMINLTPKVSSVLVKYENFHQVWAENRQRKGGHFGHTASVVVLFASFFFR